MDSKARVSARLANLSAALPAINSMGTLVAGGGGRGLGPGALRWYYIQRCVYLFNYALSNLTFSKDTRRIGTDRCAMGLVWGLESNTWPNPARFLIMRENDHKHRRRKKKKKKVAQRRHSCIISLYLHHTCTSAYLCEKRLHPPLRLPDPQRAVAGSALRCVNLDTRVSALVRIPVKVVCPSVLALSIHRACVSISARAHFIEHSPAADDVGRNAT